MKISQKGFADKGNVKTTEEGRLDPMQGLAMGQERGEKPKCAAVHRKTAS